MKEGGARDKVVTVVHNSVLTYHTSAEIANAYLLPQESVVPLQMVEIVGAPGRS